MLAEFLNSKGLPFTISGSNLVTFCLNCGKRKLGLNEAKKVYNCFSCGDRGTLRWFLFKLDADPALIESMKEQARPAAPGEIDLPESFTPISKLTWQFAQSGLHPASRFVRYMEQRGITGNDCERYKVGYCEKGRAFDRVVFPIFERTKLWNWTARAIEKDKEPKYLMATGGQRMLWGIIEHPSVIVAEGTIKALYLEKAIKATMGNVPVSFVASMGNFVTEGQIGQLVRNKVKTVMIYPDPDSKPSRDGLVRSYNLLRSAGIACMCPWPFPDRQADEYSQYSEAVRFVSAAQTITPAHILRIKAPF